MQALVVYVSKFGNTQKVAEEIGEAFRGRGDARVLSLDKLSAEDLSGVDLVVMGQPPDDADLEAGIFMENPLVIVAPPNHPLAKQKNIPFARLEDEVFLTRERGSGTRSAIERFFEQHGVQLNTGMEIASNEAIKQSVQAGLGLGLLSRDTLDMELALKKLVILDVEDFPIVRHWYVMHRKGKRLSTVAAAFKQFLLEEANALLHTANTASSPGTIKKST